MPWNYLYLYTVPTAFLHLMYRSFVYNHSRLLAENKPMETAMFCDIFFLIETVFFIESLSIRYFRVCNISHIVLFSLNVIK